MVANVWISRSINKKTVKAEFGGPSLPWLWFIPVISPIFWICIYIDVIGLKDTKLYKWWNSIEIFNTFKGKNW